MQQVSNLVDILSRTVFTILKKYFGLLKAYTRWIPRSLTEKQNDCKLKLNLKSTRIPLGYVYRILLNWNKHVHSFFKTS